MDKILVVSNPNQMSGVDYHRMVIPHANLHDFDVHFINEIDSIGDTDLFPNCELTFKDFALIIFSRTVSRFNKVDLVLEKLKRLKIPFVIDFDDWWELPHYHILFDHYKQNDLPYQMVQCMKAATAITCTHEVLADKILLYNKKVCILPNAIDDSQAQFTTLKHPSDRIRIGWSGSETHYRDLLPLYDNFVSLYQDNKIKDNIKVLAAGYRNTSSIWQEYNIIFSAGKRATREQFENISAEDANTYARAYEHFDIALCPLHTDEFNSCKSNLKILEAGFKGVPVIASNVYPYEPILNHRVNAMAVKKPKRQFYEYIRELVLDEDARTELAQSNYQFCKQNYHISKVTPRRSFMYKKIINGI